MSWEDQGRQEHGRFGNGTTGVAEAGSLRVLTAAAVGEVVVRGAATFLSGAERQGFERFLDRGGAGLLVGALPGWAAVSGLDEGSFRARVVGGRAGVGVARALQATGAAVRDARDAAGLRVASASLAAAVREGGPEWRYELRSARDQAVHAAGLTVSPAAAGGTFVAGSAAVSVDGRVGAAVLSRLGPWGLAAAGVLLAGVLIYEYAQGDGEGGGGGATIDPMRPPADPDDDGAGRPPRVSKPAAKPLEGAEPGPEGAPGGDGGTPSSLKGMRKLSEGEAQEMAGRGFHPHDVKKRQGGAEVDLYKDKDGNVYIGNKDGSGSATATDQNVRK